MKSPFLWKICNKCKKMLVANTNNFSRSKNGKYGLRGDCKTCQRLRDKKYQEEHKKEILEYHKRYYENNKEEVLRKCKVYREEHKEHISKHKKQYYKNNKEEVLRKCKIYREEHKKECSECKKKWYEDNKEHVLEKRKEYVKENPEKIFNHNVNRRTKEENQGDGISKEQWYEMMNFFDWKCAYSGEYIGGNSEFRTIDHIIPISIGGEHEVWNCIPCYSSYNFSKKDKEMLDWYTQQPFFNEDRLGKIYEWIEYAKNKYKK